MNETKDIEKPKIEAALSAATASAEGYEAFHREMLSRGCVYDYRHRGEGYGYFYSRDGRETKERPEFRRDWPDWAADCLAAFPPKSACQAALASLEFVTGTSVRRSGGSAVLTFRGWRFSCARRPFLFRVKHQRNSRKH